MTYQRLIARYCQQGDIDGATQILEFMREKQLPVNENVFNALINGHANADDLDSAVGIISVMTQAGLEPSADTYTTLLCGFARKGDVDSINKQIQACEEKEIHLLDKDYLEIVYALAVNGHEDKIDSIIEKIQKSPGYNQDSVNVILRLLNKDKINTALAVLKTMPRNKKTDGEYTDAGSFVLKQLVKACKSIEQVLDVCQTLQNSNLHTKPIIVALEESLIQKNSKLSLDLLRELKKRNQEVRQLFFWPLLAAAKDENEVFEIIKVMKNEFQMDITAMTIRDYIVPKLNEKNYDQKVAALRNNGITSAKSCIAVAFDAVKNNDLEAAAQILSSQDAYISPGLFRKILLGALLSTKDYDNYGKILRSIYEGAPRLDKLNQRDEVEEDGGEEVAAVESDNKPESEEKLGPAIIGSIALDALVNVRHNKLEIFEQILKTLVAQGLSISNSKAERIQNYIGERMTTEISGLLGKLASGELEPVPIQKHVIKSSGNNQPISVDYLERIITRIEEKGGNAKGMKKQLLIQAIRSKDLEKTEQLIEKLKSEGYTIGSGAYALLFELYATSDKIDEAKKIHEQIKSEDPEFIIDGIKAVRFVQALINQDRYEEAIKFLEENKREEMSEIPNFTYNTTCWRVLNGLAEKGDILNLNKLFNALIDNNFAIANNVLLGPLIKVHVMRNEIKEALDKFEEIVTKHRSTPWKNELACKLIEAEDAENLQRLTDLSTDVHGEVNSLYDLVFSFIECGRIRQARKILETPGLRSRPYNRFSNVCERFAEMGKPTMLEGLVEATKDLNHIDRSEIYLSLLQTYIKNKDTDKCLEMWTKMQEDNAIPSEEFLIKLATYLEEEGLEVPFQKPVTAINIPKKEKIEKKEEPKKEVKKTLDQNDPLANFRKAIRDRDDSVIEKFTQQQNYKNKMKDMTIFEKSKVVEAVVRLDRIDEANELVLKMLEESQHPRLNVFRFYLNRVASKGDIETLEKVGSKIDDELKKELSFDNRFCHSFVTSGKIDDYIKRLEDRIDAAKTPEEIADAEFKFPRGGAIGLLESNPEILDRYEIIARKYAAQNILGPVNVLWIHEFIKGNDQKANKIFKEYLSSTPRLMFHRIVQKARENNDLKLVENLISQLKNASHVTEGALGNVYSAMIDINVAKGDTQVILDSLKAAVDAVCLENINTTALQRAKETVEKAGKTFPYKIPEKKSKQQDSSSSSSSSSSDDEVKNKA